MKYILVTLGPPDTARQDRWAVGPVRRVFLAAEGTDGGQ